MMIPNPLPPAEKRNEFLDIYEMPGAELLVRQIFNYASPPVGIDTISAVLSKYMTTFWTG